MPRHRLARTSVTLIRDGVETRLPGKVEMTLRAGDWLRIETPGGGGYGKGAPQLRIED